jgi:hypothetical protein
MEKNIFNISKILSLNIPRLKVDTNQFLAEINYLKQIVYI